MNHRGPILKSAHKLDDIYKDATNATDWGQCSKQMMWFIPCDFLTHNGILCIYKISEDSEGNVIYIPSPLCNFDARILLAMYNIDGTIEYKITIAWKPRASHYTKYLTHNGVISIIKIEEDEEGEAIFVPTPAV